MGVRGCSISESTLLHACKELYIYMPLHHHGAWAQRIKYMIDCGQISDFCCPKIWTWFNTKTKKQGKGIQIIPRTRQHVEQSSSPPETDKIWNWRKLSKKKSIFCLWTNWVSPGWQSISNWWEIISLRSRPPRSLLQCSHLHLTFPLLPAHQNNCDQKHYTSTHAMSHEHCLNTYLMYSSCWATREGWGCGKRSLSSNIWRCSCSWAAACAESCQHNKSHHRCRLQWTVLLMFWRSHCSSTGSSGWSRFRTTGLLQNLWFGSY